jgi:hypothetical protein
VVQALLAAGADPAQQSSQPGGHPARCGTSGSKRLDVLALTPPDATEQELDAALDALLLSLADQGDSMPSPPPPSQEAATVTAKTTTVPLDIVTLVKTRLRQRKECSGWTENVDVKFKKLLSSL